MNDLQQLVKKNIRILFRSKSSFLILLIGPLLLMLLAGLSFDTTQLHLKVGYFEDSQSTIRESFLSKLEESTYQTVSFLDDEECITALKQEDIHACLGFLGADELIIYADYTKLNLVWEIMHLMSSQVSIASSEISLDLAKNFVKKFEAVTSHLQKNKDIIISFTTANEESTKMIEEMIAFTQSSGQPLNLTILQGINLEELDENEFVDWYTKVNEMTGQIGREYRKVSNDILEKVNEIAISESDKRAILKIVDDGKDAIRDIEDILTISGSKAFDELGGLQTLISNLMANLGQLQEKIDAMSGFRKKSIDRLRSIENSLDHNLAKLVELQRTINSIEKEFTAVKLTDADDLLSPIKTTIQPISAAQPGLGYIFPLLLVLVIMFTGTFLSLAIVSWDRKSPARLRNFMTPLAAYKFPLSLFITSMLVLGGQLLIIFLLSSVFYGVEFLLALPAFFIFSLPFSAFFVLFGMLLGVVVQREEISSLIGASSCAFFLLMSDIVLPLEKMPLFFGEVFSYNPLVLGLSLFKKMLLLHLPFFSVLFEIGILLLYCLLLGFFFYRKWSRLR